MAVEDIRLKTDELISSIGEAALNALYPSEFEYYMLSLELTTSTGALVDFLSFPVMPSSLTIGEPQLNNVRKTAGGVVTQGTNTFVPKNIIIKGDFGRKFRTIIKKDPIDFRAIRFKGAFKKEQLQANWNALKNIELSAQVKSGYGATKILQSIVSKSTMLGDDGKPFRLYLYNPAAGDNYVVKVMNFQMAQNMERNRIWAYDLQLKGVAPLEGFVQNETSSLVNSLSIDILQKTASNIATNIRRGIGF